MKRAEMQNYLEERINDNAKIILNEDMVHDGAALGEMDMLFCWRRIMNNKGSLEDFGKLRAVDNLLQFIGVLAPREKLRSKIER